MEVTLPHKARPVDPTRVDMCVYQTQPQSAVRLLQDALSAALCDLLSLHAQRNGRHGHAQFGLLENHANPKEV